MTIRRYYRQSGSADVVVRVYSVEIVAGINRFSIDGDENIRFDRSKGRKFSFSFHLFYVCVCVCVRGTRGGQGCMARGSDFFTQRSRTVVDTCSRPSYPHNDRRTILSTAVMSSWVFFSVEHYLAGSSGQIISIIFYII